MRAELSPRPDALAAAAVVVAAAIVIATTAAVVAAAATVVATATAAAIAAAPAVVAAAAAAQDNDQNDDPQAAAAAKTIIAPTHNFHLISISAPHVSHSALSEPFYGRGLSPVPKNVTDLGGLYATGKKKWSKPGPCAPQPSGKAQA